MKISTLKNIELYILLKMEMIVTSERFQFIYKSIFQCRNFRFITKKNNTLIPFKNRSFYDSLSFDLY